MKNDLNRLTALGTPDLGGKFSEMFLEDGLARDMLTVLLNKKNGFYAFESALHVFPYGAGLAFQDVASWNANSLWKAEYKGLASGITFFAEDIFGVQFGIKDKIVQVFDPETGESKPFAKDIYEWATIILSNYNLHTGYSLAHEWQLKNGHIPVGYRLTPRIPFVMGGAYELSNLYAQESVEAMRSRASVALQIRDVPDGSQIRLKVI